MRTLSTLLGGRWSRGRGGLVAVLLVTALVPVALLLTLMPQRDAQNVHAAIVNLDVPITDTATPVAVGKLLTENLLTHGEGFDWTLTDPATAAAGLANGTYLAVLTVPEGFSKTTTTLGTATPQQAVLGVETSSAHGYLAGSIATALSRSLPAGVSAQLTSGYVQGTLDAFSKLGTGIGQASDGVTKIAGGTAQASRGAQQIGTGAETLAGGLDGLAQVLGAMPQGARDLGTLTAAGAAASGDLAFRLLGESVTSQVLIDRQDAQRIALAEIDRLIAENPTMPASELTDRIAAIRTSAGEISTDLATQRDALAKDAVDAGAVALGAGVIAEVSGPVADGLGEMSGLLGKAASGADLIASSNADLAGGLDTLATAGTQVAGGLQQAQSSIPQYSADQQQSIAAVVATPVTVAATSVAGPDTSWAASLAALAPVALWLGALVVFLFVAPFSRAALTTPASAWRVARNAGTVAVLLALLQSVPLAAVLAVTGATGDRVVVASGFIVGTAIVFALLHQGLVAVFGRVGLVVSLVALGVQVVAAGTLVPHAATSDGPLALLPLSIALQGMQSVFGGSLHGVLIAAVGLVVWGVVAVILTLVGVSRARSRAVSAVIDDSAFRTQAG